MKKILYFDMDNVLVDYNPKVPFKDMKPIPGAVDAFHKLREYFDVYILTTAPWTNPEAWKDKRLWVEQYLGDAAKKRLILTHNKNLNIGDYLIDDRPNNGAEQFTGEWIKFKGDWELTLDYLIKNK